MSQMLHFQFELDLRTLGVRRRKQKSLKLEIWENA